MQLAPVASAPTPSTAPTRELPVFDDLPPTYVGLRVSTDREFSAPMYADRVQQLRAGSLVSALAEARDLLAKGTFDGPSDAAKGVVLLAQHRPISPDSDDTVTTFQAGALVELRMGMPRPVEVPRADERFDYWYEPDAVAVLDADEFELTR